MKFSILLWFGSVFVSSLVCQKIISEISQIMIPSYCILVNARDFHGDYVNSSPSHNY